MMSVVLLVDKSSHCRSEQAGEAGEAGEGYFGLGEVEPTPGGQVRGVNGTL